MIGLQNTTPLGRLMMLGHLAGGAGATEEAQASGNPVVFSTDLAKPLRSMGIAFSPIQAGSGDPSPVNQRPISGWNKLDIWNGGKNLFNKDTAVTGVWWKGNVLTGGGYNNYKASDKIPVLPGVRYILTRQSTQQGAVCYFDKNKQYIYQQTWDKYTPSRVIPDGVYFVSFTVEAEYIDSAQFEVGQTATAYEPYKPITPHSLLFPETIYGGAADPIGGRVENQWAGFTATWGDGESATDMGRGITRKVFPMVDFLTTGAANNFCNVAPYQAAENATVHFYYSGSGSTNRKCRIFLPSDTPDTTEITVITKLQTPITIGGLDPVTIRTLTGTNTIWSDANGAIDLTYLKKK